MAVSNRVYTVDLRKQTAQLQLGVLGMGDNDGCVLKINVLDSGSPANLSGNGVAAYMMRSDGTTVSQTGSVSGNTITISIQEAGLAVPGRVVMAVRAVNGSTKYTVAFAEFTAAQTRTDALVDPGHVVPSIDELLAQIQRMEQGTAAAEAVVATFDAKYSDVKADIAYESSIIRNLKTDYKLAFENGTLSNGNPVASGWAVRSADYIELVDGLTFTAKNVQSGLRLYMAMYDANKTYISQINVGVGTLTPSVDCRYIKLYTYSETTPQAQQASKISAYITNNNSIETTLQTMDVNKDYAFDHTSWIVNGGIDTYIKTIDVGANINNDGTSTYIYKTIIDKKPINGAIVICCKSVKNHQTNNPITIHTYGTADGARLRTINYKAGKNVFHPNPDEHFYSILLYPSYSGGLATPATFDEVLIANNGLSDLTLNGFVVGKYDAVPSYYFDNNYLPSKVDTIKALIDASQGDYDAFVFCTDQHWTLNARKSPALIRYIARHVRMPRLVMGGDYGSGINVNAIMAYHDAFDGEILNVTGNHELQQYYQDDFTETPGTVTGAMVWSHLDNQMTDCVIGSAKRNYYYVDNAVRKIRYIVLNDFEQGPVYQFEQEQIAWLDATIGSMPDGYLAVVFVHALAKVSMETGALTGGYAFADIQTVVDAHPGKVCGLFGGHTHFDGLGATTGGVPVIITTCDKYAPYPGDDDFLADKRHAGTITEQAFDVVVIDKHNHKISAVRIGCPADNPGGAGLEVRTATY